MDADEFYYSPFSENHELVKGELVPTKLLGTSDGNLLAKLNLIISNFVQQNKLGITVGNVGFILGRNPDTVRGTNLAFISNSSLAQAGITERFYPYPPEFIVEIASERRSFEIVKERTDEFLKSGTEIAWIIHHQFKNPSNLAIEIFRADGTTSITKTDGETIGKNVLEKLKFLTLKLLVNRLN